MNEREKAKTAKRTKKKYLGIDPEITIASTDYCIRANLWLLQSVGSQTPKTISTY
jgi:hypothetical protein